MPAKIVAISDDEFVTLSGDNPRAFAARVRSEEIARDLRNRVAAVAADLRQWVQSGDATNPHALERIAIEFDVLASEVESRISTKSAGSCRLDGIYEAGNILYLRGD